MAKPSWASVSPSSGTGGRSVSVTASSNTNSSTRSGSITVRTTSGLSKSVSLSQSGVTLVNNRISLDIYIDQGDHPVYRCTSRFSVASALSIKIHYEYKEKNGMVNPVYSTVTIPKGSTESQSYTNTGNFAISIESSEITSVSPASDSQYKYIY